MAAAHGHKCLVLVGSGHAHLYTIRNVYDFVSRGYGVTLISPGPFWYSGMGPGLLSGQYRADDDRIDAGDLIERHGGMYCADKVVRIDADARVLHLGSGTELPYDVLSLNVGSEVRPDASVGNTDMVVSVKPVSNFLKVRDWVVRLGQSSKHIIVVGGGPSGCEAAANLRALAASTGADIAITLVTRGSRLLDTMPEKASQIMEDWCRQKRIVVVTGKAVSAIQPDRIILDDGRDIACDLVVWAAGVKPPPLLRESALTTTNAGEMVVDDTLRSVSHSNVFGGGDCIHFRSRPLDKVGVYAVRESRILHRNLLASLTGTPPEPFKPQSLYLLILNLGDGTGLFARGEQVYRGRTAFWLKRWLDHQFLNSIRVSP